MIRFIGV